MDKEKLVTKSPKIIDMLTFQAAYEHWRELKGIKGSETPNSLLVRLKEETDELHEAISPFSSPPNKLDIACEAADIFMLGMTIGYELTGKSIDQLLFPDQSHRKTFDDFNDKVEKITTSHGIRNINELMPLLNDSVDNLAKTINNRDPDKTHTLVTDLILLSGIVCKLVNIPPEIALTAKLNRNYHKYYVDHSTMGAQKAAWNNANDQNFIKLELGLINKFTLR